MRAIIAFFGIIIYAAAIIIASPIILVLWLWCTIPIVWKQIIRKRAASDEIAQQIISECHKEAIREVEKPREKTPSTIEERFAEHGIEYLDKGGRFWN